MPVRTTPLAFPSAVGFGRNTLGGSGGTVYTVTNTNDSGAGSFREACEASGARIVVFNVGGVIDLQTPIVISNPNISIFGQTAVGDGIMITGTSLPDRLIQISTNEVIIRYLAFRRSESNPSGSNSGDNIWIQSGFNIIIDHCSLSWHDDGNIDIANYGYDYNNRVLDNITVQYALFTNGYGGNNKNMLISGSPSRVSLFRNLHVSTKERNPAFSSEENQNYTFDAEYEMVNCFMYDGSSITSYGNRSNSNRQKLNYMYNKNVQESGGGYSRKMLRFSFDDSRALAYLMGNEDDYARPDASSGDERDVAQLFNGSANIDNLPSLYDENSDTGQVVSSPYNFPIHTENIPLWQASEIESNLLPIAGNYLFRDAEDIRAVNDVQTRTSSDNNTSNTFPTYNNGTPL